ncbi:MAG: Fe-S cluster assembly ATPase SufC [Bacilli bacterium]|nr:Fe-S cluster assembly ATPase SufC [Bacilli bacterium]
MMKLEIKNLCVEVDGKIILDNINLSIGDSEIHAIMGPNGVGKSTLSRVIMGDSRYKVIRGDILFDGKSILKLPVNERSKMGIFLAMQYPLEIDGVSNQDFLRTAISNKDNKRIGLYDFIKKCESGINDLSMNKELIHRSLNVGFSGGEKKKNEVLQIKLLEPTLIILDELDSGLDVDSLKIVCKNINDYINTHKETSLIIITHYPMILNYLKPNYVHIINNKKIVKTADANIIDDIEKNGYSKYTDNSIDKVM